MEKKYDDKRPFQSSIPISNGLPFGRAYRPTMLLNIPMHFDFVPREQFFWSVPLTVPAEGLRDGFLPPGKCDSFPRLLI